MQKHNDRKQTCSFKNNVTAQTQISKQKKKKKKKKGGSRRERAGEQTKSTKARKTTFTIDPIRKIV